MASGDKIRVATYSEVDSIDTRVTTLEDDNDGNAVSIQDIPVDAATPTDGQSLEYNAETGAIEWTGGIEVENVTAKSIVFDFDDAYGGDHLGVRRILFYKDNVQLAVTGSAYASSTLSSVYDPSHAFDASNTLKGNSAYNAWVTASGDITNQRLMFVFDTEVEFDEIRYNNFHHEGGSTDEGAKTTTIYITSDEYTNTTYGTAVTNSIEVFSGDLVEHVAADVEDEKFIYAGEVIGEEVATKTAAVVITQSSIEPLEVSGLYYIDTVSQAISLVLPTTGVVEGDIIDFQDRSSSWETNNVTLTTEDASTIEGDSNYTLDVSSMTVQTMYNGTNWEIHATGYSAVIDSGSGRVYSYSPVPICAIQFHATNGITTFGLSGFSSEKVASNVADYHRIYTGTTGDAYDVFQEYDVVYATVSGGEADNVINLVNNYPTGSNATYGYSYSLSSVDNSFWTQTTSMGADFDNVANLFITFYGVNYG